MMQQFLKWLGTKLFGRSAEPEPATRAPGVRVRPPSARPSATKKAGAVNFTPAVTGSIADGGPGKNVLVRSRFVREDTGTHDTLKILDDTLLDADEETGIDPYNTGRFDRAKSWDFRSRK